MQRTLITILTWNRLNLTRETIKSLYKHCTDDFDLLFIDNGSTDGTVEYLQEVASYGLIDKVFTNTNNMGLARAKNHVLKYAPTEFVAFIENDQEMQPGWFEDCTKILRDHTAVAMVSPRPLLPLLLMLFFFMMMILDLILQQMLM